MKSVTDLTNVPEEKTEEETLADKLNLPILKKSIIFAMTFGFFGVNMAFSLQSAMMARIFQTLGANPNKLGWFFILPPLAGLIIQPLIGYYSDRTWTRYGRRMPYLLVAGPIGAITLVMLPNAGSFGFGYASLAALLFGAIMTLFMDLTANACMQPYKMVIGDMVPEKQRDMAWSWQQIFSNLGGIIATLLPFLLTLWGVANVAPKGEVPLTVKIAYYIAAAVLLISTIWTVRSVNEYNPKQHAYYHGIDEKRDRKNSLNLWQLLKKAPKQFWQIALVEFFIWFAIMYLWTYTPGAIAHNVWGTSDPSSAGYQEAGNWYGVLTGVQFVASILFGIVAAYAKPHQRKMLLRFGLIMGAIGFISIFFIHSQWLLILSFVLIGINNLTMNTQVFTLLTENIDGNNAGAYLGLFNCAICLPQIIASLASFALFPLFGESMPNMLLFAGVMLFIAAACVGFIDSKYKKPETNA
ncbi:sugar transporter [Staphylococcus piscifermentans]|uniref:Sugar transporter n=2 Tax=Staphylococcus piscifermentans TaxID=70258 RepID=A0A239TFD9_9STAP|nr:MFS transporter [Staphylococcus piscifermentans]GEP83629.1 sugar transporter [Staphylococcus piscifermentans]SNU96336.1 sugar transporter [Staphylococcus piscifermentans]